MNLISVDQSVVTYFTAALDCHITNLANERARYSLAHELGHHALSTITADANNTRGLVFEEILNGLWSRDVGKAWVLDACVTANTAMMAYFAKCFLPESLPRGLPIWCTNTFVGLPSPTWVSAGNGPADGLPPAPAGQGVWLAQSQPPRITVRVSAGSGQPLTDLVDALVRFLAFLRDMVRLFDRAIEAACFIRLIVRSGLRHRPNTLALALIILATCRRYGRRSEPDDHASLLNRRHLITRESRPQT